FLKELLQILMGDTKAGVDDGYLYIWRIRHYFKFHRNTAIFYIIFYGVIEKIIQHHRKFLRINGEIYWSFGWFFEINMDSIFFSKEKRFVQNFFQERHEIDRLKLIAESPLLYLRDIQHIIYDF